MKIIKANKEDKDMKFLTTFLNKNGREMRCGWISKKCSAALSFFAANRPTMTVGKVYKRVMAIAKHKHKDSKYIVPVIETNIATA